MARETPLSPSWQMPLKVSILFFLTPSDRPNTVSQLDPWERNIFRATNPVAKAVEMCMMAKMIQVHNTWVSLGCPVTYFPDPSIESDANGRPLNGSAGCPENMSHNMMI